MDKSKEQQRLNDPDQAYRFLESIGALHGREQDASTKSLRTKVDFCIVPIMFCCYTMQFIDKVLLNYAGVMGLRTQLQLQGNDFSNAASAFFIAYLIAEIPNAYLLNKVPAAKWLGANVVLWGIATACTAAAKNYQGLLAARIFLGIFEASIAPSLMLISSQWYTKAEQAPRFSFWYCGLGLGQIIGGIVSYAFQQVTNPTFAGWRIMFIVLGVVTIIIGIITFLFLPDSPMKAWFLSDSEKAVIIHHVSLNQTGIVNRHFTPSHIAEVLLDPQIWLMTLTTILISVSSGVVTTYSTQLINNFGYSPPISALLNMPSGIVSITSTLVVGFGIRYVSHRWAWIVASCVPGILGGALMSFLPQSNRAGLLAGIYLVNAVVATLIVIYHWTAANVAGHTKRVVSTSLISASFSVGNIIGPQTFQAKDQPRYIPAKIAVLATQAGGALVAGILFGYYLWENKRRDRRQRASEQAAEWTTEKTTWENLTDRQNPRFRYVY